MTFIAQRASASNHFVVRIGREGAAWLVIARNHGWLHGNRNAASALRCGHGYPLCRALSRWRDVQQGPNNLSWPRPFTQRSISFGAFRCKRAKWIRRLFIR
jgi:hypothetical protein